jgi:hypothetical protein
MTTPRKRLPYAANGLIDDALMHLSEIVRTALLLGKETSLEEKLRLINKIVCNAYEATINLKDIARQGENDHE